ncbi:peptidyl-prolyl cis-trans isomerase [Paracoccus sp. PAR01]|uniref:peptidylprolyl isomerase n=1 Tax=Paracoccus sp. PAR01 TaxID=2769282 RepID=UPI0017813AB8|nr:peptidylprolyl isomerase [Paracoccus sp. PAR01]MBD9528862.1 peptidyl-prolyl cis-trans isomerase [Paracoccus sp. PAR01]
MAKRPKLPARLLREPLLHFAILGGLIFAFLSEAKTTKPAAEDHRIVITGNEVERMATAWAQRWQRPPTAAELDGLIREAVREQVLYQEALALGLDRDDVVIRRHLRQKYEFLTQDLAYDANPDQAVLRAYYDARTDRYTQPARLSFSQIRFDLERPGLPAEMAAAKSLAALQGATGPQAADTLGDATSLPTSFDRIDDAEVTAMFGPDFTASVLQTPPGRWAGPIASGYGLHLVWVSDKAPRAVLPFEKVRQRVEEDWRYDQRRAANEAVYRQLLARYEVVLPPPAPVQAGGGGS